MKRVLIGTPLHSGAHPAYIASLDGTMSRLATQGWLGKPLFQTGSILPLLRNGIAAEFLYQTDADVLFWIDGDHGWDASDAASVLEATQRLPIVGGVYRKKPHRLSELDWEAIEKAAEGIVPYANLQFIGQDLNFDFLPEDVDGEKGYVGPTKTIYGRKFVRAAHLGTGFLAVTREALVHIANQTSIETVQGGMKIFFNTKVKNNLFQGEDFFFSDLAREAGLELWLDTESHIEHYGSIAVVGDIATTGRLNEYAKKQARR
jgi:hypothetical protein